MSDYPEHDKLHEIKEQSQAIGEFMEWLDSQSLFICDAPEEINWGESYFQPISKSRDALLAEYFGIDRAKLEDEKRQMIEELRALSARET